MTLEALLAAVFAGAVPGCAIYGLRLLSHRDVKLHRFVALQRTARPEGPRSAKPASPAVELPGRWKVLLVLAGASSAGVIAWALTGSPLVALGASFLGLFAPRLYLSWHEAGRRKQLRLQLEGACEIMTAALQSGSGLPGALELALREAKPPLNSYLARAVAELKVTGATPEVFARFAAAVNAPELSVVSQAVDLQRQGLAVNLARMFEAVQEQLRARRAQDEMCQTKTAENRTAAWIVLLVAFGTIGIVRSLAPDFMRPLFTTPEGLVLFAVCAALMVFGAVLVMRMSNLGEG